MYNLSMFAVPDTIEVINDLLSQKGLTPTELADKLHEHASTVSQWLSGSRPLSDRTVHRLAKVFGVSRHFLRTGEPGEDQPPANDPERLKLWLFENNLSQKETADRLGMATSQFNQLIKGNKPFTPRFKQILIEKLNMPETLFNTYDNEPKTKISDTSYVSNATFKPGNVKTRRVRFLPHLARAGYAQHLFDDTNYEERYINVREDERLAKHHEKALVLEVNGDSMEPRLESGDEVLGYELSADRWEFLKPGKFVAVAFGGDGIVIKQVAINAIMTRGILVLSSLNQAHGTIEIPVGRIQTIWELDRIVDGKL